MAFRSAPFEPLRSRTSESGIAEPQAGKDAGKQSGTQIPGASPSPSAETSPSPNTSTNISSAPPESYVLSCSACHGTRGQGVAVVVADNAEARVATADSAKSVLALPPGSEVVILQERGDWSYAALPNDQRGWISTKAVEKVRL